jgi:hypothetical protein
LVEVKGMKNQPENAQNGFTKFADAILDFFKFAPASVADPDIANRLEVYAHVAASLCGRVGGAIAEVRDAVHRLCGEDDAAILAEGTPCGAALAEQIEAVLLGIGVEYQLINSRQATRITVIGFLADGQRTERSITEVIPWESLPGDVRDQRLRHGASQVVFQLYPRDDCSQSQAR